MKKAYVMRRDEITNKLQEKQVKELKIQYIFHDKLSFNFCKLPKRIFLEYIKGITTKIKLLLLGTRIFYYIEL